MIKKGLSLVGNLLCVGVVILALLAGWAVLTARPNRPPTILGNAFMVVVSGSMEPTFPVGTLILSREATPSQVETGDIITFYGTVGTVTGIITHRVVDKVGEGDEALLYTRGDANSSQDPNPVTREGLIGQVVWQSLALGRVVGLLRQKAVFAALLLIPLVGLVAIHLVKRVGRSLGANGAPPLEDP